MKMETYISDLLYRHDCVIIPGLGGIITNYRSAQIHPVSHTLRPPSKSIRFNVNLQEDDGLLANYVSSCESISFASAQSKIERFVFSIQNDLQHKKEAILPKIGVLSVDINGILSFEPDLKVNYLPDAFGLEAIQSPAILRKSKGIDVSKQIYQGAKSIQAQKTSFNWKVAAVLIPLIGLSTYVSFQQDAIGDKYANYAYLNPFKEKPASVYVPRTIEVKEKTIELKETKIKTTPKTVVETVKANTEVKAKKTIPAPSVKTTLVSKPFHLVAGCFSSEHNATKLVAQLKTEGFDASVIGQNANGLFRVAFQSYVNRELAVSEMKKLKDSGKSTWLLKK
jgi:cell division septation protein DedD